MQVLVHPLRAQPERQLHKDGIAAVLQGLGHGFILVGAAPAADGVSVHGNLGRAVETVLRGGHVRVQRGGCGQDLEGGARLVSVGDQADAHQTRKRIRLVAGRIIRVVVRLGAHGQNRAGVRVHGDEMYGLRLVDVVAFAHGLFADLLNGSVDGELDAVAILGLDVKVAAVVDGLGFAVHAAKAHARRAAQQALVLQLQSGLSHAVHIGQAQGLGQERTARVCAPHILVKEQGAQLGCHRLVRGSLQGSEFISLLTRYLALENDRRLGAVRKLLRHALLR